MDGIFNIYKEKGFTSHDVVAIVRRTIHMKKVGHTGTLDPDAEGVLPVCVGKATKLSDVIMDGRKSYRAMLRLGVTTTTEDASGEVLETKAVVFDEGKIRAAVAAFIGRLEQVPPMYSAVKVNGKKLYELAREGKAVMMVSSEMPELIGICDRILVMSNGHMAGILERGKDFGGIENEQETIMRLAAQYV